MRRLRGSVCWELTCNTPTKLTFSRPPSTHLKRSCDISSRDCNATISLSPIRDCAGFSERCSALTHVEICTRAATKRPDLCVAMRCAPAAHTQMVCLFQRHVPGVRRWRRRRPGVFLSRPSSLARTVSRRSRARASCPFSAPSMHIPARFRALRKTGRTTLSSLPKTRRSRSASFESWVLGAGV
jgi:hypothetical protein